MGLFYCPIIKAFLKVLDIEGFKKNWDTEITFVLSPKANIGPYFPRSSYPSIKKGVGENEKL